jgi:hypothetical protein
LQDVRDVLGTSRDADADADGNGGSGILALPRALQLTPLRQLNLCLIHVPWVESAQTASILAEHTVGTGADPQAMGNVTRNISLIPHSPEALAALRTLWSPVNTMPMAHRRTPLFGLATAWRIFPPHEHAERFGEHLAAWEEMVAADPSSVRATSTRMSPLDAVLPNSVRHLPPNFQHEARSRIEAMKAAVSSSDG